MLRVRVSRDLRSTWPHARGLSGVLKRWISAFAILITGEAPRASEGRVDRQEHRMQRVVLTRMQKKSISASVI